MTENCPDEWHRARINEHGGLKNPLAGQNGVNMLYNTLYIALAVMIGRLCFDQPSPVLVAASLVLVCIWTIWSTGKQLSHPRLASLEMHLVCLNAGFVLVSAIDVAYVWMPPALAAAIACPILALIVTENGHRETAALFALATVLTAAWKLWLWLKERRLKELRKTDPLAAARETAADSERARKMQARMLKAREKEQKILAQKERAARPLQQAKQEREAAAAAEQLAREHALEEEVTRRRKEENRQRAAQRDQSRAVEARARNEQEERVKSEQDLDKEWQRIQEEEDRRARAQRKREWQETRVREREALLTKVRMDLQAAAAQAVAPVPAPKRATTTEARAHAAPQQATFGSFLADAWSRPPAFSPFLPRAAAPTAAPPAASIPSSDEAEEECPICLDVLMIAQEKRRLPCEHVFHERCAAAWFRRSNKCPMCRDEGGGQGEI